MTETATRITSDNRPVARPSRFRPWLALAAIAVLFALVFLGVLPFVFVVPVIGVALALGTPPDYLGDARPVARGPRNVVLGAAMVAALALVVGQPQLTPALVGLFGLDLSSLVATLLAVVALALPLGMSDAKPEEGPGGWWFLLTRRNLVLSLTVVVTVASWYAGPGTSFLPIGILVLVLPVYIGVSRLFAARRRRLEYGLLRQPLRTGLGPHRLQLVNMVLLCGLLALTLGTGTYDAAALDLSPAAHRVFVGAFLLGLAAFVVFSLIPLRRIRAGSNLLVAAGSIFLALQLILVYRPAVDPVTVASPLAEDWWVGQGGHAELVNYHQVGSTQADALDIMQVVDGRTHIDGRNDLASYYVYDKPVLAPAAGVVTFVLDGRPDLPIGEADSRYHAGNHLVIDIGGSRYLMIGHLREGSVQVRVGDQVVEGQQIARVGNSGNTTAPHIHIQAQTLPTGIGDIETIDAPELLRTLHTYPLLFKHATLIRGGVETQPSAVDPRRGDIVHPTTH